MMTEKIGIPSEDTRTTILKHLLSKDLTAVELAKELDINESAVRRHLDILENKGLISHKFEKASRGRPKKYYEITKEGESLFPKENEMLLEMVLDAMVDLHGEDILEDLREKLVQRLTAQIMHADAKENIEDKVGAVARAFDEMGFFTSYGSRAGGYYIRYDNCAFSGLPSRYASWLCSIHREAVSKVLGGVELKQEKSASLGDRYCVQEIKVIK